MYQEEVCGFEIDMDKFPAISKHNLLETASLLDPELNTSNSFSL